MGWLGALSALAWGAVPIAARDGDRVERAGPIAFGLVDGVPTDELLADLRAGNLAFVALTDAVPRGTRKEWAALQPRLDGLPTEPIPGAGEGRGDRHLRAFARAWDGLGVRSFDAVVPWRAFDLVSGGATWRVVVLDADEARLGESMFHDELFWVPKVMPADAPVVVLINQPPGSLGAGSPSPGAIELADLVHRHTTPSQVALFVSGGTPTPELVLPGGTWGEGWLGIGRLAPPATLVRERGELRLEPGLDLALTKWFDPNAEEPLPPGVAYTPELDRVVGWWRVTVSEDQLQATLRMSGPDGWADVHTLVWSADSGWR